MAGEAAARPGAARRARSSISLPGQAGPGQAGRARPGAAGKAAVTLAQRTRGAEKARTRCYGSTAGVRSEALVFVAAAAIAVQVGHGGERVGRADGAVAAVGEGQQGHDAVAEAGKARNVRQAGGRLF